MTNYCALIAMQGRPTLTWFKGTLNLYVVRKSFEAKNALFYLLSIATKCLSLVFGSKEILQ